MSQCLLGTHRTAQGHVLLLSIDSLRASATISSPQGLEHQDDITSAPNWSKIVGQETQGMHFAPRFFLCRGERLNDSNSQECHSENRLISSLGCRTNSISIN